MCLLLTLVLALTAAPMAVLAEDEPLCSHVHDAVCGYAPAQAEIPCDMDCADIDGDGMADHLDGCAYTPASEEQPCIHVHDAACGGLPEERTEQSDDQPESVGCDETPGCMLPDGHAGDCVRNADEEEIQTEEDEIMRLGTSWEDQEGIQPLSDETTVRAGNISAEEEGSNVIYKLTKNSAGEYTLTFSGTGRMKDFAGEQKEKPWYSVSYMGDIKKIVVGEGITYIGAYALGETGATELILPATLEEIHPNAFLSVNYADFETITLPEENEYYQVDKDGVLLTKDGKTLVRCPVTFADGREVYILPDGVEKIGNEAMTRLKIKQVDLDNGSLREMGYGAMRYSRLEVIEIPDTVTKIGENCFSGIYTNTKVHIGTGLQEIPRHAFLSTYATELTFAEPSSVTQIVASATSIFPDDTNGYIEMPSTLQRIGNSGCYFRYDKVAHANLTRLDRLPEGMDQFDITGSNRYLYVKHETLATELKEQMQTDMVENATIFVTNGGMIAKPKTIGSAIIEPTKEGWTFDGWYTNPALTDRLYGSGTPGGIYYAKWTDGTESSLTYTLATTTTENDTIVENDTGNPTHKETLQILPPTSLVYDGTEKTVTLQKTDGWRGGEPRIIYYNAEGYIVAAPIDGGAYRATVTVGGVTAEVAFTIQTTEAEVTAADIEATYGEVIVLKAEVQKTDAAARMMSAAPDTVAFYNEKEELLGEADVEYDNTTGEGSASLRYRTARKGIPIGESKVTAVFGGSSSLAGGRTEISVLLHPRELTISNGTAVNRTYDGTTEVTIRNVRITDGILDVDKDMGLQLTNADKGEVETATAGNNKPVTLLYTLTGNEDGWYQLPEKQTGLTVNIAKAYTLIRLPATITTTYGEGDVVTITAEVTGSNFALDADNSNGQITFYYATSKSTSLSNYQELDTVDVVRNADGTVTATMTYAVDSKEWGVGNRYICAVFSGNDSFNKSTNWYSSQCTLNIQRKVITCDITAEDRAYINWYDLIEDIETAEEEEILRAQYQAMMVKLTVGALQGVVPGDEVYTASDSDMNAILGEGYWGIVEGYETPGNGKTVSPIVSLSGADKNYYTLDPRGVTVNITKADSQVTAADLVGTYGETILLRAEISLAPVTTYRTAAGPNQAAFYYGETLLGTASVTYEEVVPGYPVYRSSGVAELAYDTTTKVLPAGTSTLRVVYGGSDTLEGSEYTTLSVTIHKKPLEVTGVTAVDREYDGTTIVALNGGTITGVLPGDAVMIGEITTGVLETPNVGVHLPVSVSDSTLSGKDSGYYTLSGSGDTTVTISKTTQDIVYQDTSVSKRTNSGKFIHPLTEKKVFGKITYTSSNEDVAKVDADTGEVTIVGRGTAEITATAEGTENFAADSASYTLTVTRRSSSGGSSSSSDRDEADREEQEEQNHTSDKEEQTEVPVLNREDHFAYMSGYPNGSFLPDRNITRAEAVVMFSRIMEDAFDAKESGSTSFADVTADQWYADSIGLMEQFGMISGYPDGTFHPDAPITRAEFATIAAKFDERKETGNAMFIDLPDSHWGKAFIEMAYNRGWISGYPDGTVRPDRYITRAEVVSVTNRMLERSADQEYIQSHIDDIRTYIDVTNSHWAYYDIMEASNGHQYEMDDAEVWTVLME